MSENEEWQGSIEQEPTGKRPRPRFQRVERVTNTPQREQAFRPQGFETLNSGYRGTGNQGHSSYGNQGHSSYGNQGSGYSKGGYQSRGPSSDDMYSQFLPYHPI